MHSSGFLLLISGVSLVRPFQPQPPGPTPPEEPPLDVCEGFKESSTEFSLLQYLQPCIKEAPKSCDAAASCVSSAIANMTEALPCEEKGPPSDTCNKAAAAFILVETFRKFAEKSVKDSKTPGRCEKKEAIIRLAYSCAPAEGFEYYAIGDLDPKLAAGYDSLVRQISTQLGRVGPIAAEIEEIHQRKLWHGAFTLALTFISPGIIAVMSPSHFRIVAGIQLIGVVIVFLYVLGTHGILLALGAVSISFLIIMIQFCFLVLRTKTEMEKKVN